MNLFTFHPDSLAAKVIKFLKENPEEELSSDDVAVKFGGLATACYTKLGPAVDAGALKRRREPDTTFVYSLGPKADLVFFEGDSLPAVPPTVKTARVAPAADSKTSRGFFLDVAAVKIEDGLPIQRKKQPATDWPALFDRLKPNQSCLLPAASLAQLRKAIARRHYSTRQRFAVRSVDKDSFRLWRLDDAAEGVAA